MLRNRNTTSRPHAHALDCRSAFHTILREFRHCRARTGFCHLHSGAEVVLALNLDSVQRSEDLVDRVVSRRRCNKNLRAVRPWHKKRQNSQMPSARRKRNARAKLHPRKCRKGARPAGGHSHDADGTLWVCSLRVADEINSVCLRVHPSRHVVAISHPFGVVHTARRYIAPLVRIELQDCAQERSTPPKRPTAPFVARTPEHHQTVNREKEAPSHAPQGALSQCPCLA